MNKVFSGAIIVGSPQNGILTPYYLIQVLDGTSHVGFYFLVDCNLTPRGWIKKEFPEDAFQNYTFRAWSLIGDPQKFAYATVMRTELVETHP